MNVVSLAPRSERRATVASARAPRVALLPPAAAAPRRLVLEVEHHELDELRARERRRERRLPVGRHLQVGGLQRLRVHDLHDVRDLRAQRQLRHLAERCRRRLRQPHQIVLADRDDLDRERVLLLALARVRVLGDDLLRDLHADGRDRLEERDHLLRVRAVVEVEVEPVAHLDDVDRVDVRAVLEDQLLEHQEGALVRDLLPHLRDGRPRVLRLAPLAAAALLVADDVLDDERLLHHGARHDLLLDAHLDLDPPAVRLGPDEARVDEPHVPKPARLLEQQRHQLGRLGLDGGKAAVATLKAAAPSARVLLHLLGDALADVVARL